MFFTFSYCRGGDGSPRRKEFLFAGVLCFSSEELGVQLKKLAELREVGSEELLSVAQLDDGCVGVISDATDAA